MTRIEEEGKVLEAPKKVPITLRKLLGYPDSAEQEREGKEKLMPNLDPDIPLPCEEDLY